MRIFALALTKLRKPECFGPNTPTHTPVEFHITRGGATLRTLENP
jgi:hypothetical protein